MRWRALFASVSKGSYGRFLGFPWNPCDYLQAWDFLGFLLHACVNAILFVDLYGILLGAS